MTHTANTQDQQQKTHTVILPAAEFRQALVTAKLFAADRRDNLELSHVCLRLPKDTPDTALVQALNGHNMYIQALTLTPTPDIGDYSLPDGCLPSNSSARGQLLIPALDVDYIIKILPKKPKGFLTLTVNETTLRAELSGAGMATYGFDYPRLSYPEMDKITGRAMGNKHNDDVRQGRLIPGKVFSLIGKAFFDEKFSAKFYWGEDKEGPMLIENFGGNRVIITMPGKWSEDVAA